MLFDPISLLTGIIAGAVIFATVIFFLQKSRYESELKSADEKYDKLFAEFEKESEALGESNRRYLQEHEKANGLSVEKSVLQERISALEEQKRQYEELKGRHESIAAALSEREARVSELDALLKREIQSSREKELSLVKLQEKYDLAEEESGVLESKIAGLVMELEKEREAGREKLELLENSKEQLLLQFKELSEKIAEKQSEKFTLQNKESISRIVNPFKEQIEQFKKQVNDVYVKEAKERSMLQQELHHLKELNVKISREATSLTNALRGESKKQGIWGEMILEKVLESSGLRLGHEYDREVSMEHEDGRKRYRPDVLVHLPDSKEIIIDAKTSLTAYDQYINAESEEEKKASAAQHLASLNTHIKQLSDKNYTKLKGIKTLDFVFMFVPIESALLLAMELDGSLFDRAFAKNILLVGPTTLMIALRAVENTWRHEKQQKNAQEIAKRAGLMYDKFIGFVTDVENLGKQIATVEKTYANAYDKLHNGRGSLTGRIEKLKELGADTNKSLPDNVSKMIES
jgi:DNA recombination protein RmuC